MGVASCQHFLVDFELERVRHEVLNYAIEGLNATIVADKIGHPFYNTKCAAKMNLAVGLSWKNTEGGGFRYFHTHENITLLDRFKLECTLDNLGKLKVTVNETDVIETCSGERKNLKWSFYNLPNLTVFAAVLKSLPMLPRSLFSPNFY